MKAACYIIAVFICAGTGCRTQQPVVAVPLETQTIIRERLIEVPVPADSALVNAYLECDSNFHVLLRRFDEQKSANMETALKFDDTGKLSVQIVRVRDTVYVAARDSIIRKEIAIPVQVPVEVNRLTGFQHFQIWAGRFLMALVVFIILLKIYSFRT